MLPSTTGKGPPSTEVRHGLGSKNNYIYQDSNKKKRGRNEKKRIKLFFHQKKGEKREKGEGQRREGGRHKIGMKGRERGGGGTSIREGEGWKGV